ncbi:MAG: nucleoside deaminase [Sphaerochaetaceae bacterium]
MDKIIKEAMTMAIEKAKNSMRQGCGGPFGAAVIKEGKIISVSANTVLCDCDPSAHAEINAIREACRQLQTHNLSGCILYATGYPCPMCLSAIIWANIKTVYYGCEASEAEEIGFRDDFIYRYLEGGHKDESVLKIIPFGHDGCIEIFKEYQDMNKELY